MVYYTSESSVTVTVNKDYYIFVKYTFLKNVIKLLYLNKNYIYTEKQKRGRKLLIYIQRKRKP